MVLNSGQAIKDEYIQTARGEEEMKCVYMYLI